MGFDKYLDAAVELAVAWAVFALDFIRGNRLGFTVTMRAYVAQLGLLLQGFEHSLGAVFRQGLVVFITAFAVGMAANFNGAGRDLLEHGCQFNEQF